MSTAKSNASLAFARSGRSRSLIDPSALMQIKNLTMRAKAVVEGFTAGLHRSPLHGFSVEFSEYRPYVEGDDPRSLDWKLLARTDRYYIKQYEDETNRRCYVVIDQSRSMAFGSSGYTKAEYARTLAATFAYYLTQQRDAVGLMTCGIGHNEFLPARHRKGHLQHLMRFLDRESVATESNIGQATSEMASLSKRRGLVVIISDFLIEPESLTKPLGYLRGRGHEVLLIRVLDPSEISFALPHSTMLVDLETGREIYVDPEAAKTEYRLRFLEHENRLVDLCHRRAARVVTMATDQPLDGALLELVNRSATTTASHMTAKRGESLPVRVGGV